MNGLNLQNMQALMQAQAQAQQKKPIVEFRAGILNQKGTTVTADERRGTVQLVQSDDGLLHLHWKLRNASASDKPEVDLILFEKGATYERVPECTDGRVYVLQFKSSSARSFFWMQEPKEDKDDEICKTINDSIENPPPSGGGFGGLMDDGFDQAQLLSMLSGMTPQAGRPASSPAGLSTPVAAAPARSTGTATTATGTTTTTTSTTAPTPVTPAPAASSTVPDSASLAASLTAMARRLSNQAQDNLTEILDADRVAAALDDKDMEALMEHLPESQRSNHDLVQTLRSPQVAQTLQRMTSILNSEQFSALMASLSLPTDVSAGFGVSAFIEAIEAEAKKLLEEEKKE